MVFSKQLQYKHSHTFDFYWILCSHWQSPHHGPGPWMVGWCFGLGESCTLEQSYCRYSLHIALSQSEEGFCSSSSPQTSPASLQTDLCWSPAMPVSQQKSHIKLENVFTTQQKLHTTKLYLFIITRMVRKIGPTISAALIIVMFPVSSSIWKIFPSFPDDVQEETSKTEKLRFLYECFFRTKIWKILS